MEKKVRVLSYIVALVLLVLLLKTCDEKNNIEDNLMVEKSNVRKYKSKNGQLIEYNNVVKTKFKDLELYNEELSDEIKDMRIKNPEVVIKSVTKFHTDTMYIVFNDTLPCLDFKRNTSIDSLYYNIDLTLTKDSLTINSIDIPNSQTIAIGEKKNGIFKRNEYVVSVKNSNPYISTDTLETYSFKKDVPFLEKPVVNIVIGVVAGIVATKLIGK